MPKKDAPAPTDPASIESIARAFALPRERKRAAWDEKSFSAFKAAFSTALRTRSQEKLDAALSDFGGLPPQGEKWDVASLLSEAAAADPEAFGFEDVLRAQIEQVREDEDFELGEWLRGGMVNHGWIESLPHRDRGAPKGQKPLPVLSALAADNPMALAKILKDPESFAALKAMEPEPSDKLPSLEGTVGQHRRWDGAGKALMTAARKQNAGFETSLLWQALGERAMRCAALLCALPEFSAPYRLPGRFASVLEDAHWTRRREQGVFQEDVGGAVELSLFESAIAMRADLLNGHGVAYDERSRVESGWRALVESMVDHAGTELKSWAQKGTGMGCAEIAFARLAPHAWGADNDHAAAQREVGMSILARMEKRGFAMDWAAMALAGADSPAVKEWLELRSASRAKPGSEPKAPARSKSI